MKAEIDFKIKIEKVEDFSEVFNHVELSYLEDVGITQVGAYGDARLALELLKYVNLQLDRVVFLRSENPDLMTDFNESVLLLQQKNEEFKKLLEIFFKDEKSDN